MSDALVIATSCVAFFGTIITLEHIIRPRIFEYRFDENGLSYVLFHRFVWRHLPYRDIVDVEVFHWHDLLMPRPGLQAFRERLWPTRRLARRLVALRRPNDHVIYVTPVNPDAFVEELLTHLKWASPQVTSQHAAAPGSQASSA